MTNNRSSRTRRATAVAAPVTVALGAALLLAGCGGNGLQQSSDAGTVRSTPASPGSSPSATTTPSSGSSSGPSAGSSPRPSAGASTSPPATGSGTGATAGSSAGSSSAPGRCTTAQLALGIDQAAGGGAAGSEFVLLTLRNTGSTSCTLDGHPGVSFVGGGNGSQIGSPAVRTGSSRAVTLAAGQRTTAVLQVADAGNYDPATCAPTTSDGLRVYPPGSRSSLYVAFRTQACQGSTGSSPQLQVSSVGRAQG